MKRRIGLCLALVLFTGAFLAVPAAAQNEFTRLCHPDSPVLAPLAEMERVDDLTFLFTNELGQQFLLRFDERVFADDELRAYFEEYISNVRMCFEAVEGPEIVVRSEGELEVYVLETEDGIEIGSNVAFPDAVFTVIEENAGLSMDELILSLPDPGMGLDDMLGQFDLDLGLVFEDALYRVLPDPELVDALLAEAGYPSGGYEVLRRDFEAQFEDLMNAEFVTEESDEGGIGIEIELLDAGELGDRANIVAFYIDPTIYRGWLYRHEYRPRWSGAYKVSFGVSQGKVTAYLCGAVSSTSTSTVCLDGSVRRVYVWGRTVSRGGTGDSGLKTGLFLRFVGEEATNYYTLYGSAWIRVR